MNISKNAAKVLLTLPLLVFGLNKLVPEPFLSAPPPSGESAQLYMQAFFGTYLDKTVALFEVVGAILVWIKKTEVIGLLILLPILFNINMFHLFHDLDGVLIGAVIMVADLFLLFGHKDRLEKLLLS
jgi:hypothetical protein